MTDKWFNSKYNIRRKTTTGDALTPVFLPRSKKLTPDESVDARNTFAGERRKQLMKKIIYVLTAIALVAFFFVVIMS